jgi:hypothetical protein
MTYFHLECETCSDQIDINVIQKKKGHTLTVKAYCNCDFAIQEIKTMLNVLYTPLGSTHE